jgi:hypothetical protein
MPARCHNDTCSIVWSEVNIPTPAYQADVVTDAATATPTIQCAGDGLEVMRSATSGNLIQSLADGLFAAVPDAIVVPFSDPARTSIGADKSTSDNDYAETAIHSWTNTTGASRLVLVRGQYRIEAAVLGEGSPVTSPGNLIRVGNFSTSADTFAAALVTPFNAMVYSALMADIDAPPTTPVDATNMLLSGNMVTFDGAQEYQFIAERQAFLYAVEVGAGQTLNVRSRWAYQGNDQTVNVIAYGSGPYAGLGAFLANCDFIALPFAAS